MTLALAYQTQQTSQQQQIVNLLDHLCTLAASLKDVREEKCFLREQKYALFGQFHALSEQQQALCAEESTLLQEELALLAQVACLRERTSQVP